MTTNKYRPVPVLGFKTNGSRKPLLRVCCYCIPGAAVFGFMPSLKNAVDLSHGVCLYHLTQARQEIKQISARRSPATLAGN